MKDKFARITCLDPRKQPDIQVPDRERGLEVAWDRPLDPIVDRIQGILRSYNVRGLRSTWTSGRVTGTCCRHTPGTGPGVDMGGGSLSRPPSRAQGWTETGIPASTGNRGERH